MHQPLRLAIDRAALQANWRWLADGAGVPAGAAIKADGYGIGARETFAALLEAVVALHEALQGVFELALVFTEIEIHGLSFRVRGSSGK